MTMVAASGRPSLWSELLTVRGRTNRGRYWLTLLVLWVAIIVVVVPVAMLGQFSRPGMPEGTIQTVLGVLLGIVAVVAFVMWILMAVLVAIRRLHDRDKSGHWLWLFYLVPGLLNGVGEAVQKGAGADGLAILLIIPSFILSIWGFVEIGCLRGTNGPNRFGADPLQAVR